MICLTGVIILLVYQLSPDNRGALLGPTEGESPAALWCTAHVWRVPQEHALRLPKIDIVTGQTCHVRAGWNGRCIFSGSWGMNLHLWCLFHLIQVDGGARIDTRDKLIIGLLKLFGTEKTSPRSPNPVQSMAMPRLMEIWLHSFWKWAKSVKQRHLFLLCNADVESNPNTPLPKTLHTFYNVKFHFFSFNNQVIPIFPFDGKRTFCPVIKHCDSAITLVLF